MFIIIIYIMKYTFHHHFMLKITEKIYLNYTIFQLIINIYLVIFFFLQGHLHLCIPLSTFYKEIKEVHHMDISNEYPY